MAARLTEAEARKLGITVPARSRAKKSRAVVKGPWHIRCWTCKVEFHGEAAEDRHLKETHHARYENVIEG